MPWRGAPPRSRGRRRTDSPPGTDTPARWRGPGRSRAAPRRAARPARCPRRASRTDRWSGLNCAASRSRRRADSRVTTASGVAGVVSPSQEPRSRTSHSRKMGARWWRRYVTARRPSISSSREGLTRARVVRRHRQPGARRLHLLLGQIHLAGADVLQGSQLDLLESHHLLGHQHLALLSEIGGVLPAGQALEDPHAPGAHGVGEVVDLHPLDVGDLLLVLPEASSCTS